MYKCNFLVTDQDPKSRLGISISSQVKLKTNGLWWKGGHHVPMTSFVSRVKHKAGLQYWVREQNSVVSRSFNPSPVGTEKQLILNKANHDYSSIQIHVEGHFTSYPRYRTSKKCGINTKKMHPWTLAISQELFTN